MSNFDPLELRHQFLSMRAKDKQSNLVVNIFRSQKGKFPMKKSKISLTVWGAEKGQGQLFNLDLDANVIKAIKLAWNLLIAEGQPDKDKRLLFTKSVWNKEAKKFGQINLGGMAIGLDANCVPFIYIKSSKGEGRYNFFNNNITLQGSTPIQQAQISFARFLKALDDARRVAAFADTVQPPTQQGNGGGGFNKPAKAETADDGMNF